MEGDCEEESSSGTPIDWPGKSNVVSRLSKGFSLLWTSSLRKLISSRIMDKAELQDSSSLNANVHLPSTKAFVFNFPWALLNLAGSRTGKEDGRIRRCNHLRCFSSILGWKMRTENYHKIVYLVTKVKVIIKYKISNYIHCLIVSEPTT